MPDPLRHVWDRERLKDNTKQVVHWGMKAQSECFLLITDITRGL